MSSSNDIIVMAHGGGGVMTQRLIDELIVRELGNPFLDALDDGACVEVPEKDLVLTTDSYVVEPIVFPGGDIGALSVCGTINDLAMQGAEPRYLTLGFILEEGLRIMDLERVVQSIKAVTRQVGVPVVTGDTKVVGRHGGRSTPGMFINTTGLGVRRPGVDVSASNAQPGDTVIVTGTVGDHGVAVMNERENLGLESALTSDVAPLWGMTAKMLDAVPTVHCLRDPTRGGLAAALCGIAMSSSCGVRLKEDAIPVRDEVRGACDILGLDPLNVANEGKAVVFCSEADQERVLEALKGSPEGRDSSVIGNVIAEHAGTVVLETRAGGERIVDVPMGESLPRIC